MRVAVSPLHVLRLDHHDLLLFGPGLVTKELWILVEGSRREMVYKNYTNIYMYNSFVLLYIISITNIKAVTGINIFTFACIHVHIDD